MIAIVILKKKHHQDLMRLKWFFHFPAQHLRMNLLESQHDPLLGNHGAGAGRDNFGGKSTRGCYGYYIYIYMVWLMIVISISVILTIYDVYIYWSAWPLNIIYYNYFNCENIKYVQRISMQIGPWTCHEKSPEKLVKTPRNLWRQQCEVLEKGKIMDLT